mgnify:CR=1 FL=1
MIGIVIVAHGGLAREYLATVEHVVGKQKDIIAISIEADHDRAQKQQEIMIPETALSSSPICSAAHPATCRCAPARRMIGAYYMVPICLC